MKKFEDSQHSADRHEGWRYFFEKTELKAGTDPLEATQQRQSELERRESKALRETKTPIFGSPSPQRNFRNALWFRLDGRKKDT